jgi:hypothetical protein
MPEEAKNPESLSSDAQEVMRNLISAIRAVKLYPPNNPVYSLSIKKSYEVLDRFLGTAPDYRVGVQKAFFTYQHIPVGKEAQLNRAIAQDLFAKGIREIVFSDGVTEEELLELYRALALTAEDMAMKSGIASILWEKGATHIKVAEAGLDEVIMTKTGRDREAPAFSATAVSVLDSSTAKQEIILAGRTLVLGDLMTDPAGFGAGMVELAKQTRAENESTEDRLFALYHEAGQKIREEHPGQSDTLFEGLAQSVLFLESPYRERLIAGRLYGGLDEEIASEQKAEIEEQVPNELHEILTGRFSHAWTVQQVSSLLKQSAARKIAPPSLPVFPAAFEATPIPRDLGEIVKGMAEYTPEEMEELKTMGEAGMESDIIEAAVRTLIFLLPLVKSHGGPATEREIKLFSGVVHQLEDLQGYLIKNKDYDLAALINRVFHMPVEPAFRPRLAEAVKKTAAGTAITTILSDLRKYPKGSPEYLSVHSFLFTLEREATEVLLELLAEETDRSQREFLMDLLKDLGKNQLMLIGEHLSDVRWYFVRNIVSILGESKTDHAIAFLHRVADHKNIRIRQEVVKGLISIGGKKAASLLAKFLNDKDAEIQLMAIRGFAELKGIGAQEARPLMAFLEGRPLKSKGKELTVEAMRTLARIGGPDAGEFLARYDRVRWWKPRKLQRELRAVALWSRDEIKRRQGDGGRAKR